MRKELSDIFEEDSVIKILAFCIITFGVYFIYKLYHFTRQINKHSELKIPQPFVVLTISIFIISLISLLYGLMNLQDISIIKNSIAVHVFSAILDISWIMMVRNRFNLISNSSQGDKLWLSPFMTSIFHVIYVQHKINQALASSNKN